MTKQLAVLTLALAVAPAGEARAADLFGGYSLLRLKDATLDTSESFHGWQASLAKSFGKLALLADVSGHSKGGSDDLTYMAGPRLGFGALSVHALAGGARTSSGIEVLQVRISESATSFAWAVGGAVALRVSGPWDVRLQGDYLNLKQGDENVGNLRAALGVAYRFGAR